MSLGTVNNTSADFKHKLELVGRHGDNKFRISVVQTFRPPEYLLRWTLGSLLSL